MIRNYLLIAWRNIRNNKLNSFINIIGLAIGLAACLSILAFVQYELSFDRHIPESARVYRLALNRIHPDQNIKWAVIPPAVAPEMARQLPEIEDFTRIGQIEKLLISNKDGQLIEGKAFTVDSGFFDMFGIKTVKGSLKDYFSRIDGMILTESAATRYFGTDDAVGKTLITPTDGRQEWTVAAVVEDPLPTTHFDFDIIVSINSLGIPGEALKSWSDFLHFHSYFLFTPGSDITAIENKIQKVADEHMGVEYNDKAEYQAWLNEGNRYEYFLQPLTDIHLESDLRHELGVNSSIVYVYLFSCIAAVILFIAAINFVNLATAKAAQRNREVGIRKTIGARRIQLIIQFLAEAMLTSLIALVIALPLTQLIIPLFNQITGKAITINFLMTPGNFALLCALPVLLGLLAGSFPAFYISAFRPSVVLQKGAGLRGAPQIRKILLAGQFVIVIFLIAGTITIFRQMKFFSEKSLGFKQDQVLIIENSLGLTPDRVTFNAAPFRNELKQIQGVSSVSFASEILGSITRTNRLRASDMDQTWVDMSLINGDRNFIPTLELEIIAGRNFTPEETDARRERNDKVILNETAARLMGWTPEEALGQAIRGEDNFEFTVIGVVADFNFASLRKNVGPIYITGSDYLPMHRLIYVRMDTNDPHQAVASIESLWQKFVPQLTFQYRYLDESLSELYEEEQLTGKLFITFSGLAIFLCCLGLLGLTAFLTERRSKEIGVRKIMGAKVSQIMLLLSHDFLRMVLIATIIAAPLAWFAINRWLENFAYRVDNSIWVLVLAGLLATAISWLTVSYVAYRAARSNPVKSLRNE